MSSAGPTSTPLATILVVDDNAQNRALVEAALEDEGYAVVSVESGQAGIEAFSAHRPDCVLLDVRMPGLDGFAVCERIRTLPGGAETPVVFLTALRDIDTFDHALHAGGDDFLSKPVRPAELTVRVSAALKLRRMSAENRAYHDQLRRQRDDLMRVQLQKERLSAFVVHDLKSPINVMDLHAQVLLRDPALPQSARDSAQHIRAGARALTRMVLNLLDISKSEEGKLTARLGDVDLLALGAEIVDEFGVRAQDAHVQITLALEQPRLRSDPDLLRRVLENLTENAIRHAPEHSQVRITSQLHDGHVELRVSDAGAGIVPELRTKVFEPFVQVDNGERLVTRAGRGLGLTFCRVAVEAMGGSIGVDDGRPGASFWARLPL